MNFLIDLISEQISGAFEKAGFDAAYGKATLSNRPDLCEYQCNGALAAAKKYHKAPIQIANAVLEALGENEMFASAEAVMPGFLNLNLSEDYLASYLRRMAAEPHYGTQNDPDACTKEILNSLGEMYAAGGEFTENINKAGGEGTAVFAQRAIAIYCR